MKLLVLSDLHLEHAAFDLRQGLEFDAVVLAGDVHTPGQRAIHWARLEVVFGSVVPVIFVPGNHEYYGTVKDDELARMRTVSVATNVKILDRDVLVLDDQAGGRVRFLGCTLWTDFALPFVGRDKGLVSDVEQALATANRCMNDFRLISTLTGPLTAQETLTQHRIDRAWLLSQLAIPFDGETVVVTHHAPATGSIDQRYQGHSITPAFVSDLPAEYFGADPELPSTKPALWIHGHTHQSFDYQKYATRVVSNPRGYRRGDSSFENANFDAGFLIHVGSKHV